MKEAGAGADDGVPPPDPDLLGEIRSRRADSMAPIGDLLYEGADSEATLGGSGRSGVASGRRAAGRTFPTSSGKTRTSRGERGAPMEDFAERLSATAARVGTTLDRLLPREGGLAGERELAAAMRHGVLAGGKRLRAFLAIEAAALFGPGPGDPYRIGAAMECLHAYSLIHDDLPSMDDDDLRRGQPTVHRKWDEATAVLAGDALQALAFEILAAPETHPDGAVRARLCLRLAQAAGAAGMVGGQAIDLAAERAAGPLGMDEVRRLQALKTGALIEVSAEAGAMVSGVGDGDIARVAAYARALGEAFQIADDLLDVTGSAAETGKRVGKDREAGKATFVDILGIEGARERAADLVAEAKGHLDRYGTRAEVLAQAAEFVVERRS